MTLGTLQEFYKKLVGAYWTAYQAERKQSGWAGTEWLRSDKGQEMIQHWSEVVSKNKAFVALSRKAAEKKVKGMAAIRDGAHNSGYIDGDSDSDNSNDVRKKKRSLKAYDDNDSSSSSTSTTTMTMREAAGVARRERRSRRSRRCQPPPLLHNAAPVILPMR